MLINSTNRIIMAVSPINEESKPDVNMVRSNLSEFQENKVSLDLGVDRVAGEGPGLKDLAVLIFF